MNTPTKMIESLDAMSTELTRMRSNLDNEASEIVESWAGLGNANGQREDHAAALLCRLSPHLADIAAFVGACNQQISDMNSDPFGRKEVASC